MHGFDKFIFIKYIYKKKKKEDKTNRVQFLRIGTVNDEKLSMHSLI